MKKTISVFLTLSLVLAMVFVSPLQIFAAENENTVLVMKGKQNVETQEIEIEVKVEENTGVCGMLLSLVYDTSVFTLTNLEYGTAFSSLSPIHTNTETDEGYGIYPFKITYLGEENDTSTGKMMSLRFRVKDGAPDGSYTITLKHERDQDVTYLKGNEILTKNLLISGAKITLSENKVTSIDTIADNNEQNKPISGSYELLVPIIVGGLVLVSATLLLVSVLMKGKKNKEKEKT